MWQICFPVVFLTAVVWWLIFHSPVNHCPLFFISVSLHSICLLCWGPLLAEDLSLWWLRHSYFCSSAPAEPEDLLVCGYLVLGIGLDHWRSSLGGKECWEQFCVSSAELQCLIFKVSLLPHSDFPNPAVNDMRLHYFRRCPCSAQFRVIFQALPFVCLSLHQAMSEGGLCKISLQAEMGYTISRIISVYTRQGSAPRSFQMYKNYVCWQHSMSIWKW